MYEEEREREREKGTVPSAKAAASAAAAAASGTDEKKKEKQTYRYCNNKMYDYVYNSEFTYQDIGCSFDQPEEVSVKGESQMFFSTMLHQNMVAFVGAPEGGNCTREVFEEAEMTESDCPSDAIITRALGRCYCRSTRNTFVSAVENMTLNMEHKYEAMYGSGIMPRTFVRREGSVKNLYEFKPGEPIAIPLYKILEVLQLSLDGTFDGKADSPHLRLKGLQITAKLQYYNYHQAPGMEDRVNGKPGETVCILEFSPQDMWATLGNSVAHLQRFNEDVNKGGFIDRYKYGVKVIIQASGIISKTDVMFMINAVIQGLVLLNVAVIVTQQVAFNLLGDRSKMYRECGNEKASFERESARFAIQSIVAGYVFQVLDEDKSGSLDQKEIYEAIKDKVQGSGLTDEEMDVLAGFVIHQAELDKEANGTGGVKGEIDLSEWDNLFASGFMDFHSLSRTVKALGKEESKFLLERAKSFKTGLKTQQGYGAV